MNSTSTRHQAALQAAHQRVKTVFRACIEQTLDALSSASTTAPTGLARENASAALFDLNLKQSVLLMTFNERWDESLAAEQARRDTSDRKAASTTNWDALSLVDEDEMEAEVAADRFAQSVARECDAELKQLDPYVSALLPPSSRPEQDRNPLRPEAVGKACMAGLRTVSDRPDVLLALTHQFDRVLARALTVLYRELLQDFQTAGIEPTKLAVRHVKGPGTDFGTLTPSGHGGLSMAPTSAHGGLAHGGLASGDNSGDAGSGAPKATGQSGHGLPSGGRGASDAAVVEAPAASGTPIGQVDQEVMALIRRLAVVGPSAVETGLSSLDSRVSSPDSITSTYGTLHRVPKNIIVEHREALKGAATSTLDHMVIDVVGSLFDQILSDPKVPPQMARHIARLQLPVLRAALGDQTFFSSRKHPVRLFINRIASLAVAYDDFSDTSAQAFLTLVSELVDEIVSGDFDQIEPYEEKLDRLELFIVEQVQKDVIADGQAGQMLDQREVDLILHQRYMLQLKGALGAVPMADFLRDFLSQVWSQALMHAVRTHGDQDALTQRLRAVGTELVLSVQPKGTPQERKQFLLRLPSLMKDLNEGLGLIGWPDAAKKAFLGLLLPAHSDSLKGKSMSVLEHNLLAKQLTAILAAPPPTANDMATAVQSASPDEAITPNFTAAEAASLGLVQEHTVDWAGDVDIDLSDEPDVQTADLDIAGLPSMAEPLDPSHGATLADNLQIGFSYRMHYEGGWHKVRLSHVSPGRSFFVFTRGKNHSEAISMTSRMLHRLCDTGRLRAFENAYLIERATARARKQLASLSAARSQAAPL